MDSNLHAESFDHDGWEDKKEKIHEIKVDTVEVNDEDDVQRIESKPKRDGPAWNKNEESEIQPTVVPSKKSYQPKHISEKKAPVNDIQSFPDIGVAGPEKPVSEKSSNKNEENKDTKETKDTKSNNRFIELEEEEVANPEKEEEKKKGEPKPKKKKGKKAKWTAIDAKIKLATTEADKDKNVFDKTEEKVIIPSETTENKRNYESRSFPVSKPSDGIFRNFDNKPPPENKAFARTTEENSKFGKPKSDFGFVNKQTSEESSKIGWRSEKQVVFPTTIERKESDPVNTGEQPKKRFFNNKKTTTNPDPLQPKTQESEKEKVDGWGEKVKPKETPNAWHRNK